MAHDPIGPPEDGHASLRNVAGLVAGGAPASEVFAAVARAAAHVTGSQVVLLQRFEPDDMVSIVGAWGAGEHPFRPGTRWSLEGSQIAAAVRSTGRPVRVDDFGTGNGPIQAAARALGMRSGAGAPIVVDGDLWGVMVAGPPAGNRVLEDVPQRLGEFTDLVAMAIASTTSREALARVAAEQAALRRVATHVARESSPEEVFAVVADEAAALIGAAIGLLRFERDGTATLLAQANTPWEPVPLGTRLTLEGDNILGAVLERGEPVRFDDADAATGPVSDFARTLGVRSSVATPIVVEGRRWGVLIAATREPDPLPFGTESRLEHFTELLAAAIANAQARDDLAGLAEEQAALRRLATQVARGASADESFEAVIAEIGRLLQADAATLARYEDDGAVIMRVGSWSRAGVVRAPTRARYPVDAGSLPRMVLTARGPRRVEDLAQTSGAIADLARSVGWRSAVGAPVIVDGRPWGLVDVMSTSERTFPPGTEAQLAAFAQLVPIAIANAQSREDLAVLAEEQGALRRVAVLVAEERPAPEVLAAVVEEVGRVLRIDDTRIVRFEPDGTVTVVASWGVVAADIPLGTRWQATGDDVVTRVLRFGRPARMEAFDGEVSGPIGDALARAGVRCAVATPVVVEAQVWGAMIANSLTARRLHADTETRLGRFADLVATAVSNLETRAELAASRRRLAAASVEERRRVVRDLHDGAQQRLVHTVIALKLARDALLERGDAAAAELLDRPLSHAQGATDELRELAHGILPAVLLQGGLHAGVEALVSRTHVPTAVDVLTTRLPAPVEATAYFVVAEALTNSAKHAGATHMWVTANEVDGVLHVEVRDDGLGGARAEGSGLVGLADRLAAIDGRLRVDSPAGEGTRVAAEIPISRGAHVRLGHDATGAPTPSA